MIKLVEVFTLFFQVHDLLNFFKEFFLESSIFLDKDKVFLFEFLIFLGLKLEFFFVVGGLVNKEKPIFLKG